MCKILLISGHGAGDPGAIGVLDNVTYREADLTREVTAAVKLILETNYQVSADIYPIERNAYHDWMSNKLAIPLDGYTFVIEVHFNAFMRNKDSMIKGVEIYATANRKDRTPDSRILENMARIGFTNRGVKTYDWAVIYAAQKKGSPAALLEVCFIDDEDDMALYMRTKQDVAEAIAYGLADSLLLERKEGVTLQFSDVKNDAWYADAVDKVSNLGIMQGSGGKFRPNDTVTRAELAAVVVRLLDQAR